jgi:hypothetical protein
VVETASGRGAPALQAPTAPASDAAAEKTFTPSRMPPLRLMPPVWIRREE